MDDFETLRKGEINSDKGHLQMRRHWKGLERQVRHTYPSPGWNYSSSSF